MANYTVGINRETNQVFIRNNNMPPRSNTFYFDLEKVEGLKEALDNAVLALHPPKEPEWDVR